MQTRPRPVDVHVGQRLRMRRNLLGVSQTKLGQGVGLTFQQIQKYERGANRIGASRLHEFSRILDVPVSYFFDDYAEDEAASSAVTRIGGEDDVAADIMTARETLTLVRSYYGIKDEGRRKSVLRLVKVMSGQET